MYKIILSTYLTKYDNYITTIKTGINLLLIHYLFKYFLINYIYLFFDLTV